jgi:NAD(P)-dependent dehydrogenase (short-subunit alcohol dehydrogenase family)
MQAMSSPDLTGARILVVGTGKMGTATARRALAAGADVTLSGRSEDRLRTAATESIKTLVGDPVDPDQAARLLDEAGPLDHVAVLSGAPAERATSLLATQPRDAQQAFGRFWLSYNLLHAAPGRVRDGGSITLLSGSSGRRPAVGWGFWGTLHGSIEALARSAALELSPIRVNTVSPGGIAFPMERQLIHHAGEPDDIAAMVVALMANPAVTATVVDVDGGERLGTISAPG